MVEKSRGIIAGLLVFFILILAANSWSAEPVPISVGILVPQEENSPLVEKLRNAYKVAVQVAFEKADQEEIKVRFNVLDYPADPAKIKETLEQAIKSKGLKALVGGFSAADSLAIAEVAEKNGLPYISIAFPGQANKSDWVFDLQPPADYYVAALKGFANDQVKAKSLAVIYEDSFFGMAMAKSIKSMAEKNSWSLGAFYAYSPGELNFKDFFVPLQKLNPDMVVLITSAPDAVFLLRQSKEYNINPKAFIGVGPSFSFHELSDPTIRLSEYICILGPWIGNNKPKDSAKFAETYTERFGYIPTQWENLGFSAVKIMTDAIIKADSDSPRKIRGAIADLKKEVTPYGGQINFVEDGAALNQNHGESAVAQWQKGKLLIVYPDKYRESKPILPTPTWKERK